MKIPGLIGGLGPESTILYYKEIIARFQNATGMETFPELLIRSVDMTRVLNLIESGARGKLVEYLAGAAEQLAAAGAQFCAISSNTPHLVFNELREWVSVPMVSIVETAARTALEMGLHRIALIGTKFTMDSDFYRACFAEKGMTVVVPEPPERQAIHDIIFPELENGIVRSEKKAAMLAICTSLLRRERTDGILLGCTELPLMLGDDDFDVAVLDTARLHITELVKRMIEE